MHHGPSNPRHASDAVTRDIRVHVAPFFLSEHSDPGVKWVFGYKVTITNQGQRRAKLLTRRWLITDADGRQKLVEGEGVVGQSPDLSPGQSFEYSSFCPLETPWGTMEGAYQFYDERGDAFDVAIGRFYLVSEPAEVAAR
ncbi:MAG: Co2+/Mg2+ efflux protein ApaG [Phycisphaerales bacterium]